MSRKSNKVRRATVILPDYYKPTDLSDLPDILDELYEPHRYEGDGLKSWRLNDRSHHRILLEEPPRQIKYKKSKIWIPTDSLDFKPFMTHYNHIGRRVMITNHLNPEFKLERQMNRRQRDYKHKDRKENDHSRANTIGTLDYRNPDYRNGMYGALTSGNQFIAADTATALNHLWRI